ncbi:MAG: NUDIX domain-containing protein [Phycisphaerales bacterium]
MEGSGGTPVPRDGVGPRLRTDIVDVYVFRVRATEVEFLQLLRREAPMAQTWHPVMGHVEAGERATQTAVRELVEEIGLDVTGPQCLGLWQLNQVHPFYIAATDEILLSPRFAARVVPEFEPRLCEEHERRRWVPAREVEGCFMWPGQRAAIAEVLREIVEERSLAREFLRVKVEGLKK